MYVPLSTRNERPELIENSTVRDTLGTAIYFMVYESGKQIGNTFAGDHPNSNKLAVVAAGGMCGLVSWAMICTSFLSFRQSSYS